MRLRIQRAKLFLTDVKQCGLIYILRQILTNYGLIKSYPIHHLKYSNWETADKVRRIKTHVLNYDDFISGDNLGILSNEVVMRLKNGLQLYVRPAPPGTSFNGDIHAIYETILRQDYGTVSPGKTVIDIGAFIGDFTVFAAYSGATVYAFEPSPESFGQLLKNINLMTLSSVKAFNAAVIGTSNVGDNLALSCDNANLGSTQLVSGGNNSEIQCLSLKDFFTDYKIDICDLLKLDCEGYEYEILSSLDSSIYSKIQNIVLEFHNGCPKRLEGLRRKLEAQGFFVETIVSPYSRVQGLLRCWK
jgi:FkbM family methyltransferase